MDKNTEQQFQKAAAAVDQAVATFIGKIESMLGKWDAVAPAYIVERMALAMCAEMSKLVDDSKSAGPVTLKLSNALADYRDSQWEDR
jgi:hypothetical protein